MVRDLRIKEFIFPTQNVSAASAGLSAVTSHTINGEILEVRSSLNQLGSLTLAASGLSNREIWRLNASSGTNPIVSYPGHFNQVAAGSIAGASIVPFVVNDTLILSTGSLASGTAANLNVTVLYR